ncbi:hypothetical protein T45_07100 [Streptomyces turgidiscabies]|nr:hypothetical protein T45_07100 [Streptomyces turgidiscabies]
MEASATSHDSADMSRGRRGAPGRSRAWVPDRYSSRASAAAVVGSGVGVTGAPPVRAAAGTGASASTPVTHRAQQEAAIRDAADEDDEDPALRAENPMVISQT